MRLTTLKPEAEAQRERERQRTRLINSDNCCQTEATSDSESVGWMGPVLTASAGDF